MFIFNCVTSRIPLLGGALIMFAAGCSPGAEQATVRDTATTTGTDDTALPQTDTAAAQPDSTTVIRTQSAAAAPATKPRVKPSIDPGRKATTPRSTQTSAPVAPAVDTASSDSAALAAPATSAAGQDKSLKYDAATNTVTFELIGGPSGFQFNGYASGGATLTVPAKANVVMNFVNKDGTPHSAEIISGEGPIPNAAGDPAIPRAYTIKALEGLPQEASDPMRFTVPASGSFRIFCGVPGHGLSGMWIWMKVDPKAKTPSFGPTKV
jgi:hypothetical protein